MIYKKLKYLFIVLIGILLLLPLVVIAKDNGKDKRPVMAKTQGAQIVTTRMDINNLNALEANNGFSDYNTNSNLEGTEYPKGTGKTAVFQSGFLWGGFVRGDTSKQVRVGGSAYRTGLQPGPIINGVAADPTDPRYSIYRVRADIYPGGPDIDLSNDAALEGTSVSALRAQYEADWKNWPADLGAPYKDVDGDGTYNYKIDIPGVPGADQTIYYVANDLDGSKTTNLYGTQPIGIEVHATFWAYAQSGALGNMYFKKWDIINKGSSTVDSMYVSFWADVDLGTATDDLVGCDTTLSLQFTYNGEASDAVYSPLPPPADGFDFFQGPVVAGSVSDSAIFGGTVVRGKKNLPMTAAYFFINGDANYNDPTQGDPAGATQFYHFFNGEYGLTGAPFIDNKGNETKFAFYGDPVTGTGWLDGVASAPGDRRQGMASGPITMAPGETQEVVVAEIFAGAISGVDYLQAITLLKTYDKTAQNAYNNFFNLPSAPPAPTVTAAGFDNKIVLDWGETAAYVSATENSVVADHIDSVDVSGGGAYKFQGYNVYQFPYKGASISEAKLLATYDLVDSIKYINYVDLATREVNPSYFIQYGTDSGVRRYFIDSVDVFNGGKPLHNGTPYYFAVTAYSYNPKGVPRSLENPTSLITVIPQSTAPGVTAAAPGLVSNPNVTHVGTADASVALTVVNPNILTGDKYQVTFHNELYSLGSDGIWNDVTPASKKLGKVKDVTGSTLSSTAVWSETKSSFDIHYLVDVVSVDYDYVDGVQIKLPAGTVIDAINKPISNNDGSAIDYTVDYTTNTIFFGDSVRSGNGLFAGGEDIVVRVHSAPLPLITNYIIFDDGYGNNIVDAPGVDTLKTIANNLVTQHQWNITDLTTGTVVVKNQTVLGGVDIYDPATNLSSSGIYGPGGSSHSTGANDVGGNANVFAGIKFDLSGSYVAPSTIGKLTLNGKSLTINASSGNYQINDFTSFGNADGTAVGSLPSYGLSGGATDIDHLQQDYELKWTGVSGDTVINGKTVVIIKSGGSIATLFGAKNYSLANHPLNPNPGVNAPFTIRIPFEVWNTDKKEQVNLLVYDRNYAKTNDPTVDGFSVWNTADRVYAWVVNTKYTGALIDDKSSAVKDSATWSWVFFASKFKTGDDMKIIYNNPLQIGKDVFTFTIDKNKYSAALAKQNVNAINVFPNPYYGVNSQETSKYARYVTFNHLPGTATIRIFNLAGIMVRTINHTNGTQFQQWDLNNDSGLPVASGLYIVYIDMPTIGATKILKAAIIQEQQFPDHF